MKKLRSNAYRLLLAGTVLLALLGVLLAVLAALLGDATRFLLPLAVALCAAAIAALAIALHFRTGHILRSVRTVRPSPAPVMAEKVGLVAVDNTILTEVRELHKSLRLSINNERFLMDELQRMNEQRPDDH